MFWMTQSLLSSWLYYMNAEDQYTERALDSLLSVLRRERREKTRAMQEGIRFEKMVNDVVSGGMAEDWPNERWRQAVRRFAGLCSGGQAQVPVSGKLSAAGMDFVLYGVCDYVKAGRIYDIKKVTRYEYGKYAGSPQHPMYGTTWMASTTEPIPSKTAVSRCPFSARDNIFALLAICSTTACTATGRTWRPWRMKPLAGPSGHWPFRKQWWSWPGRSPRGRKSMGNGPQVCIVNPVEKR